MAWQVPPGPIPNLVELLENAGAMVVEIPFDTRKIDAVSFWPPKEPPFFFINTDFPADRTRFSLAHELGHMIMHSLEMPGPELEQEADRFASSFLMPKNDVLVDLRHPVSLRQLGLWKQRWRVSMAALLKRAADLNVVSQHQARRRWTELSRLGLRIQEPHPIAREKPQLLRRLVSIYVNKLGYSEEELCFAVSSSPDDFRRVFVDPPTPLRLVQ